MHSIPRSANHRARWAAIGAAVAVSLGAGGLGIARAASSAPAAYSAMSPCRLLDTRADPAFHVGNLDTLGPDMALVAEGWGDHGQCSLPNATTALQLNVTAVGASNPTFLTLYPADEGRPNASHLNPAPGQPPTPNAVTVQLDDAGRFSIFNRFGTVDVIVDVVGTYAPTAGGGGGGGGEHTHDDDYYTKPEIDAFKEDVADSLELKASVLRSVFIPATAFRPVVPATSVWASPFDGAYSNVDNAILDAPLVLPAGAEITAVRYYVRDTHATYNLLMLVRAALQPSGSQLATISSQSTSGAPGQISISADLASPHRVESGAAYFVRVTSAGWGTAMGDLRIKGVEIEYRLPGEVVN